MPKNRNVTSVLPVVLILIFLSLACGNSESERVESPNQPVSNQSGETKTYETKVKVKTPDDQTVVEVKIDGDEPKIEYGGRVARGAAQGDKRKYALEGGGQIAEVKIKDEGGFKVRAGNGTLLWKVKIDADKIKISDNEENQNAFELKKRDDGAKIERNEAEIGEVKFYQDRGKVKVKDAGDKELFDINTDKYAVAFGVLALSEIPEELRFIIFAELLARNL